MTDWKRAAARRFVWPLLIAIAGLVVVIVSGSTVGDIVGWSIVGAGATVAIGLVFLEVGYSEDRERAREQRGR